MTERIKGIVEAAIDGDPIVTIEDGGVWISGANAEPGFHAGRVSGALIANGFTVGTPVGEDGGLFLPVPAATRIEPETRGETDKS